MNRAILYGVFLASITGMIAASLILYKRPEFKDGSFLIRDGELVSKAEVQHLNPLLDVKLRILKDYPIEKINRSRATKYDQVNDMATFKAVYYNLFMLSDWEEIQRLFEFIENNKSFDLNNNDGDIESIVHILDSTILLVAYLYDRLGMRDAALYYYTQYWSDLRPISFSRPGYIDRMLGARLMVSRLKQYYLRHYARYQTIEYGKYSYLNQIIENSLGTLLDDNFRKYEEVIEKASPNEESLLDLSQKSDARAKPFLLYERCIFAIRESGWSDEAAQKLKQDCALGSVASGGDYYLESFATAAYIFYQMRMYSGMAEETHKPDPSLLSEIEQAVESFIEPHGHAPETEFLVDDMKIKFAVIAGNAQQRERLLCDVAKSKFPEYDFAPYAKNQVKEKGINCD
jgi:hypothetical protein